MSDYWEIHDDLLMAYLESRTSLALVQVSYDQWLLEIAGLQLVFDDDHFAYKHYLIIDLGKYLQLRLKRGF